MRAVSKKHLDLLAPYLVGEKPTIRGEDEHWEWDMYCPLHEDNQRSSGINLDAGVWNCQKGCGGGRVIDLIERRSEWVDPPTAASNGHSGRSNSKPRSAEKISDGAVAGWISSLWASDEAVDGLMIVRGLEEKTIKDYELGWDKERKCYAIPIRNADGELVNIRRYTLNPGPGTRKIWSVAGKGKPELYPMKVLASDPHNIIICEGELDALISIQNGYPAITRTASASTWKPEWGSYFQDRVVLLCHDMDSAGQDANRKVRRALQRTAREIHTITLPYPLRPKHGKDLTDFWLEYDKRDFWELLAEASDLSHAEEEIKKVGEGQAAVIDAFDASNVGIPLELTVTITGKREPGYNVPHKNLLTCTRDAGEKCAVCPLYPKHGEDVLIVPPNDPVILSLVESTDKQVFELLRELYGIPKCNKLVIETTDKQSVEELFARPSIDHSNGKGEDYKNIKIISVGRHDSSTNTTVRVVGSLFNDPRRQLNSFQAWEINKLQTSVDHFDVTPEIANQLKIFRPKKGERPLKKLGRISRDIAAHITKIYGRPELHAALDLVWHSALSFDFDGSRIGRGWLELLVVGDTRTGKSEAAEKISRHYRAGEIISCESATFAGIIGGAKQFGAGREWTIKWGTVPLNDRRLVVLDEVSGLTQEQIAKMSSVRSSGTAELTMIEQERTYARTRLVWLGNPRDTRMSDYTYGVRAIKPLIGNSEDIARFDFAMSVRSDEVGSEEINRSHEESKLTYGSEACSMLVRWVWSRKPEQIRWASGAEAAVYDCAKEFGERYTDDPPLVQFANIRVKIARVAVALAARLFSTDSTFENIVVRVEHVEDAMAFVDMLYRMDGFGYADLSKEAIKLDSKARDHSNLDEIKGFLQSRTDGLVGYLRGASKFKRIDLEEVLNLDRDEAKGLISTLHESGMIRTEGGFYYITGPLHEMLREIK